MITLEHDTESSIEVRYLEPDRIRVFRHDSAELRMTILDDRTYLRITATRAFPLSDPGHYVGILQESGGEIGIIRDLRELDQESRAIIKTELRKRYFTPIITEITSIKTEFGLHYWDVDTDKGQRQFIIRSLRESVFEISPNRYLLHDVYGNRFEIRDVTALDKKSKARIERLL